jgi:type I restriction enzyme S subunit
MSLKTVLLGSVCHIEKGNIGILKAIPGEYPMVVTGEERKSHNEYQFDTEAVLIPLVSGTGHGHASIKRLHYQTGKFALGSILCAVIPKNNTELSAEYLFRYLSLNKDNELVARMKGMANVTLPMKEIAKIEIPLPSLAEQLNFIEKYKQLETQSELLSTEFTNQLDLVKQLRQSFLREAMQGKLVAQNPADGNAKDLLEQIKAEKEKSGKKEKPLSAIKEEEIPFEIPENWVWCRIDDVLDFINGKAHEQFLSNTGKYVLVNSKFVSTSGEIIKRSKVQLTPLFINDIVLVMSDVPNGRALGRTFLIDENDKYTLNQRIGSLSSISKLNSKFLSLLINRNEHFLNFDDGNKQTNLRKEQIISCPLPLPPLPEQQRIVEKLDELMQMCDELEQSIKGSQSQNEKLLQQVLREALRTN